MNHLTHLALLCITSSSIWAGTVVVNDPFNISGNSDVIGNKLMYDAQSVQVTTGPGTLTIDIRTNFQNPNLNSFRDPALGGRTDIGDLFFTVDGTYAYGIPLAYHNGPAGGPWGDRLYAGHIYEIGDPSEALLTARQALHDPAHIDYRPDAIVWMINQDESVEDVTVGKPTVQVIPIAGNNGGNGPLYDIRVNTSLPDGLFSSSKESYGVEFATSTSGSDIVQGALDFYSVGRTGGGSSVPEPATIFLIIGAVLVALSRFALRRFALRRA